MTILPSKYLELVSEAVYTVGVNSHRISRIADDLRVVRELGKAVWIAGNGGSAATASHFSNDLGKMAEMRAFSLPDMTSVVTAYGNDHGWENMFSEYLEEHIQEHDVLFCISVSGKSKNILRAADVAVRNKNVLYVLTGMARNNPLALMPDATRFISVDHPEVTVVEDVHLAVCHAISKGLMR